MGRGKNHKERDKQGCNPKQYTIHNTQIFSTVTVGCLFSPNILSLKSYASIFLIVLVRGLYSAHPYT